MADLGPSPPRFAVWDVVRVAFPYAGQPEGRRRPALVIAAPASPPQFSVVWLLMITTARHERWPGDVDLVDWRAAGLAQPCVVRAGKVSSIDTRLIEPIGHLAGADRRAVAQSLGALLRDVVAR